MTLITGVINTYQEAGNIRMSIASLRGWCDEIIVVDQHSTDGTREIAASEGARVLVTEPTGFVEAARQVSIDAALGTWVVVLDADELVHPELARELRRIAEADEADVIRIPRKNIMLGRWIRYRMWWPNCKPRFFKKGSLVTSDRIHMGLRPVPGARIGELPWREGRGYRDGTAGLTVAVTRAYYRFLVLAKTWDERAAGDRLAGYEASKRRLLGQSMIDAPPPP